jgi:hypothetical protein
MKFAVQNSISEYDNSMVRSTIDLNRVQLVGFNYFAASTSKLLTVFVLVLALALAPSLILLL